MKHFLALTSLFLSLSLYSQNTLSIEGHQPAKANLEDIAWISGHWRGTALNGTIEEIWSPALGGSMMGSFKMVHSDAVTFYELMHIQAKEESLLLQIKHFNKDFTGWEKQHESEDFQLVKIDKNHIYFDGLTFEKIAENQLNIYVIVRENGQQEKELKFSYTRFSQTKK